MFFVFGKCPFLLRWKNVLSGSNALHLRFIRNKSVTLTVISVNRPFIIRYTSGYRAFFPLHVPGSTYRSRELRAAEEINFVTG